MSDDLIKQKACQELLDKIRRYAEEEDLYINEVEEDVVVDTPTHVSDKKRSISPVDKGKAVIVSEDPQCSKSRLADCVYEDIDEIRLEDLARAPAKLEDTTADVQDPLEEVNLGINGEHKPTFISSIMPEYLKKPMIELLKKNRDCFAWDYNEMPGLDRTLVEHRLPIKHGFRPFKQNSRRMATEIVEKVKEEIERLLKAGFIRPAKYVEWLSNIVPVVKKNGKLRVCIDFRDLNKASPKDEYVMPIADMLVDAASGYEILSFMDGHSGYNQIFIAEEDVPKTAFRCPGAIGTFEWVVMAFGLINAGATYQRAMNLIFHDMIGKFVEVYIDDIVVKSNFDNHLDHLAKVFARMRAKNLKMNPLKCAFGVSAGNFLGFLVHQRGIEVDKNKARAIMDTVPPNNKKELQRFLGQVNYLRRFISNCAGKVKAFSPLLRLKSDVDFRWETIHQEAFDSIKQYLSKPPVLMPPKAKQPLKLYISASTESLGCLLAQDVDGFERAVYYLSRTLTEIERKYTPIERLCLALYFACNKLRYYMIPTLVYLLCETDVIKYMLSRPIVRGRIAKWSLALLEFNLQYIPQKAVKGQALADFLADHPDHSIDPQGQPSIEIGCLSTNPWTMTFDGSRTNEAVGVGIVLISPAQVPTYITIRLDYLCSNNQAEYEALRVGLDILLDLGAKNVIIKGDSQLVVNQVNGDFRCNGGILQTYLHVIRSMLDKFDDWTISHIPRSANVEANELAQAASGYKIPPHLMTRTITVDRKLNSSAFGDSIDVCPIDVAPNDWRYPIIQFHRHPDMPVDIKIRRRALGYVMLGDQLYKKNYDELCLLCISEDEALKEMAEVHEGICGAHQAGIKMRWLIRRHGFYWPTILQDCISYAKGCQACQKHGPIQHVPAVPMNPIVKPWPFRGWAMDVIGKIYPPSSKNHAFILVATDYFTKWVEAIPLKSVTQSDVIKCIKENIIHRFGLPQSITADQGSIFTGEMMYTFAQEYGFEILHSTPYYAQANGQAEATNKILKTTIEKMVQDNPRAWHEILSEVLWAYRTSKRSATGTTPFALTFGHDAVLPMEVTVRSLRVAQQDNFTASEYNEAMMMELEDLDEIRLLALDNLHAQKLKVARSYDKKVRSKSFQINDLVWKTILPLGSRDNSLGKWSPNWEGPFMIHEVLPGGAYVLSSLDGEIHDRAINGKYLKNYVPTIWEAKGIQN